MATSSPLRAAPSPIEVRVMSYDSLAGKKGLASEIIPEAEKICGIRVRMQVVGSAAEILSRALLDRKRGRVSFHVAWGIDQTLWPEFRKLVEPIVAADLAGTKMDWALPSSVRTTLAKEPGFIPFDFGEYAFLADREALAKAKLTLPTELSGFLADGWKRKILLEDPRTSTPGLGFVLWINSLEKDARVRETTWKKWRTQWLTLAPGWGAAYGLFLKKEAPVVWTYTTSLAYHRRNGDGGRFQLAILKDGAPLQLEGAAMLADAAQTPEEKAGGRCFLKFLVSDFVQAKIPDRQWMWPVVKVPLPKEFQDLPRAERSVLIFPEGERGIATVLSEWRRMIQ